MDSPEVKLARNKLDGVLASLIERESDCDDVPDDYVPVKKEPDENSFDMNGMLISPRKRPQRAAGRNVNKKRRKKEDARDGSKNNLLLSLTDRRFSFDQFPEDVSLYALTRAWIRSFVGGNDAPANEPNSSVLRISKIPGAISKLPTPEKGPRGVIEPPARAPSKYPLDLNNIDMPEDQAPNMTLLKLEHIQRWREQREQLKKALGRNERRYKSGFAILKQLYHDRRHADS